MSEEIRRAVAAARAAKDAARAAAAAAERVRDDEGASRHRYARQAIDASVPILRDLARQISADLPSAYWSSIGSHEFSQDTIQNSRDLGDWSMGPGPRYVSRPTLNVRYGQFTVLAVLWDDKGYDAVAFSPMYSRSPDDKSWHERWRRRLAGEDDYAKLVEATRAAVSDALVAFEEEDRERYGSVLPGSMQPVAQAAGGALALIFIGGLTLVMIVGCAGAMF